MIKQNEINKNLANKNIPDKTVPKQLGDIAAGLAKIISEMEMTKEKQKKE